MQKIVESNEKGGLCVLDSMTPEEFQNLVRFFSLLLEIDLNQKDVVGDLNPEVIPPNNDLS